MPFSLPLARRRLLRRPSSQLVREPTPYEHQKAYNCDPPMTFSADTCLRLALVLLFALCSLDVRATVESPDADVLINPDKQGELITDWGYDIKENGKADHLTPELAQNLFVEDKMTCLRLPIYGDAQHPAHPADGKVIESYYTGILQAMANARKAKSDVVFFASKKLFEGKTFPGWVKNANGVIPEAYARMLADYLSFMQAHGFVIDILGVDNEMEYNKGDINPQKFQEIIDNLRSLSRTRGFTMPRRLIGPDSYNPKPEWVRRLDNMGWGDRLDIVGTHYYPNRPIRKLNNLVRAKGARPVWHTELHWGDRPNADIFNESQRALAAFFDCTDNGLTGFVWWDYARTNATIRGGIQEALTQSTIKARPIEVDDGNGKGSRIVLGQLIVRAFRNDTSIVVWAINNNPTGAYEDYKFRLENGSAPNKVSYKQWATAGLTSGMATLINQNTFTVTLPPKTITLVTIPE